MSVDRPVLLIGGTRGTGLLIAKLLLGQGTPVRILARDPARAIELFGATADIVGGDLTRPDTLPRAVTGIGHVIFTAGCRSGHPVREPKVKATEYDGVVHTLEALRRTGFDGRFMYMTASGVTTPNFATWCLNVYKGNTLVWRRRAEDAIRASGIEYTIVRTGVLLNRSGGQHGIEMTQAPLALSPRHVIARADVADAFVAALPHPRAARATFEIVWRGGIAREQWTKMFDRLKSDDSS